MSRQDRCSVICVSRPALARADIKSTNLLGNVLANQAASEANCAEAILHLPDGTLRKHRTAASSRCEGTTPHNAVEGEVLPSITRITR